MVFKLDMPRKARMDAPGALHHIIVRGIDRSRLFLDDLDRGDFLDRLGNIVSDTKTSCFAWSLMTITPSAVIMDRNRPHRHGNALSINRRHRR
jgi:hypothetical protein